MAQHWISIVESNWIFSKFCILIYIYIYYHYFKTLVNFFSMQTRFDSIFFIFNDIKVLLIEFIEIHNLKHFLIKVIETRGGLVYLGALNEN